VPRITYSREAQRSLEGLDVGIRRRVDQRIEVLARGQIQGKGLHYEFAGIFSLRVGDWRVLYRQLEPDLLEIVAVAHRREVYRQR